MDPLFMGLRHVALNVRNVRRSLEFYSNVLGMKLEWMPDEENAYLTSGQDNLALHQLPQGHELGPWQMVHHIGFVVRHRRT
jgi:catechol 2,3-dioxygenase-like lactoylglutathione lyase family enzyme